MIGTVVPSALAPNCQTLLSARWAGRLSPAEIVLLVPSTMLASLTTWFVVQSNIPRRTPAAPVGGRLALMSAYVPW